MEKRRSLPSRRPAPSKPRKRSRPLFETRPVPSAPPSHQPNANAAHAKPALAFQHHSILRLRPLPHRFEHSADHHSSLSDYSTSPPLSPPPPAPSPPPVEHPAPPNAPPPAHPVAVDHANLLRLQSGSAHGADYVVARVRSQPVPLSGSVCLSVARGSATVFGLTLTTDSDPVLVFSAPYAPFIVTVASVNDPAAAQRLHLRAPPPLHPDAALNHRIRRSLTLSDEQLPAGACVLVFSATSADHRLWEASDPFQVAADLRTSLRHFNRVAGHPSISPGEQLVPGMSVHPRADRFGLFEQWPEWSAVCDHLHHFLRRATQPCDLRLLVCGAGGSGKSTFTRCVINHLLQTCAAVVLMDSDVGQSEMSPPGLVAAYCVTEMRVGSGAASNRSAPLAARFFGDTTPREDPDQYALFIERVCKEALDFAAQHKYPVVVNSDGWTNGIGADLLHHLSTQVNPSHLAHLRLQGHQPRPAIAQLAAAFPEDRCFTLTTPRKERDMCFPPILLRELHVATYFSKELALGRVHCVHVADVHLVCVDEKSLSGMSMEGLSACLVALGSSVPVDDADPDWAIHGYGIVRGCDPEARLLYICTPIDQDRLQLCDTLLFSGGIQLPQALFFSCAAASLLKSSATPFILSGSVHTAESMRSRGTLARK